MVDDLEERLSRYRADLDAAVAADLARRHGDAGFNDADLLLLDLDHEIRLEPTVSAPRDRRRVRLVASLGVAAAVTLVLVAVVASRTDDATPGDQPSPAVTVPPTVPPQALPWNQPQFAPGTYYVDEVDGTPTPRIFATIGPGWWNLCPSAGWNFRKRVPHPDETDDLATFYEESRFNAFLQRDIGDMSFSHPDAVYSDACHWGVGKYPGPVDTLDGLVTALIEQRGWTDVTAPSDISVDGYVGKAFQRTAPADMSNCTTRTYATRTSNGVGEHPDFRSWEKGGETALTWESGRGWVTGGFNAQYEPGQTETLWVLDLDGTMVVITTAASPEPSAGAPADFAADVLDSIRIERP